MLTENVIETWAKEEYREGISAHAAARQLCRSLGCYGHAPVLKKMLEDLLAEANKSSHEYAMQRNALRTVLDDVNKH